MPLPGVLHIDDANADQFAPDAQGLHVDANGVPRLCMALPRSRAYGELAFATPYEETTIPLLAKSDRIALARRNAARGISIGKYHWFESLDQDGLGWCHGYGTTGAAIVAREVMGLNRVLLAAESVAGPVVNWANRGADPTDDVEWLHTHGACSRDFPDKLWSQTPAKWKAGWQQNALQHRCLRFVDISGWNQYASFLVQCMGPVVVWYNWWSHCIFSTDLVVDDKGGEAAMSWNSWGKDWPTAAANGKVTMAEGRGTPSGAIGIYTMSTDLA